jgi:hypothetical protein
MLARCFPVAVVCAIAAPAFAQAPPGADVVPTNAFAFVSFKIADLWDAPGAQAAPSTLPNSFTSAFGIQPAELERITLFWPWVPSADDQWVPFAILTSRKPYDPAKVVRAMKANVPRRPGERPPMEEGDTPEVGDLYYLGSRFYNLRFAAVYLLTDRTVLLLPEFDGERHGWQMTALAAQLLGKQPDGPLAGPLTAAGKHTFVAAARLDRAQAAVRRYDPDGAASPLAPFRPLLKAKLIEVTADAGERVNIVAKLTFPDAESARKAEPVLKTLFQLGVGQLDGWRKEVEADPGLKEHGPLLAGAGKSLDAAEVKADGATVRAVTAAEFGGYVKVVTAATALVRDSAARHRDQNSLKILGLAIHNFHDVNGRLPADIVDKDGKPLLSWRAELLPYLEHDQLWRRLDRTKAWDDPANKEVLDHMPTYYQMTARDAGTGKTYFQMFTAPKAGPGSPLLVPGRKTTLANINDGTSNTLMVVEAADPVVWLKPGDIPFDPKNLPKLGSPTRGQFPVLFCDGSVRELQRSKLTDDILRALITINGGEPVAPPD